MLISKKGKGEIAELAVASKLVGDGWKVLFPFGEDSRYDLVAEKSGRFVRVQVKYVTPKNGALNTNCRSSNNWSVLHYSPEDIDAIAVYDADSKNIYFIPSDKMNSSAFKLRLVPAKNNQKNRINIASNFSSLI